MKIIKVSTELEMSVHEFPEGTMREQNKVLYGMVSCVKEKCIYQWKTLPNSLDYQFRLLTGCWKE